MASDARRILCLGEALVDLICERHLDGAPTDADAFVPHFGGAVANTAAIAARAGAAVSLAGGVGDDPWGRWLHERLRREGVGISLFELIDGRQTPLALVAVAPDGEASYQIYGQASGTVVHAIGGRVAEALGACAAVLISSNTLVLDDERAVTMEAREVALDLERPVIFDPNLRLHRWRSVADATRAASLCVPGARLVRTNAREAALMTGEQDAERAAAALVDEGAHLVVVSLGPDGAILRGALRADVPGTAAKVLSTVGAGDALTGVLLAALSVGDLDPSAVPAALPDAVAESARACERWGALD